MVWGGVGWGGGCECECECSIGGVIQHVAVCTRPVLRCDCVLRHPRGGLEIDIVVGCRGEGGGWAQGGGVGSVSVGLGVVVIPYDSMMQCVICICLGVTVSWDTYEGFLRSTLLLAVRRRGGGDVSVGGWGWEERARDGRDRAREERGVRI